MSEKLRPKGLLSVRAPDGMGGADMDDDDGPSVLLMIVGVAVIVALVILVFFAAGYLFGRQYL
jgi:hypothetical protein